MFAEVVADVEGHGDDDLVHRLREVEERRRRDEAEQAVLLAEIERRRLFRNDGHATMWGLLRSTVGWSDVECRNRMRVARLVTDFPAAGELLYEAHASVANITEIARGYANPRCGNQIGDVIGTLLNEARRAEYDDLRRVVRHWEQLADVDGSHRDRAATHEARTAQCGVWDGVGYLAAQWGQADGITNREIFDRYVDAEWRTDWDATVARYGDKACTALMPRTDAQRRADAVTRIFADAASAPPGSTGPVTVANIHIDHQTFSDLLVGAGVLPDRADDLFDRPPTPVTDRRCATVDGEVVDPDHATRILLEQYVRFIVHDDRGIPIRWGRRRRLFTGAARQAVMSLSPRCTHPGCRVRTSRCQADHTIEHSKGGFTDPDNGGPKCPGHNLIKNKGYRVHRDRCGYWHTYRPDGSEVP